MTTGELFAWVIIPLGIFLIGGAASGIMLLVKGAVYFAKSREAQESTAKTNQKISEDLERFIEHVNVRFDKTDAVLANHGERIVVLEDFKRRVEH